ncbi:MAG: DsbA family protein [Shimia sp.]
MMLRPLALMAALAAAPAAAFDIDAMSEAEREAFGAAVRSYLIENPEVLVEAIQALEARQEQAQQVADVDLITANWEALTQNPDAWVGGNPDGDVTLVEFMDYRCGFCRRAHPEVLELVESDGDIRWIVVEYPILGPESELSARFALATREVEGDEAYGVVHDALMTIRGAVDTASLRRLAEAQGYDADAILAEMDSANTDRIIAENRLLAQRMQISGTPSFVLGEETLLRGYLPLDAMQQLVSDARS